MQQTAKKFSITIQDTPVRTPPYLQQPDQPSQEIGEEMDGKFGIQCYLWAKERKDSSSLFDFIKN